MHKCKTKTFGLKRHLELHNLSLECSKYAYECAKIFAHNSKRGKQDANVKETRTSNTCLVNKKNNYKVCPLRVKLFIYITDNLQNFYTLDKHDTKYEKFIRN